MALKHFFRSRSHSQDELSAQLDRLRISATTIHRVSVTERECLIHCHLLEQLSLIKEDAAVWAIRNAIAPEATWRFYVNKGVERMIRWFEGSSELRFGLDAVVPPLDVILMWHAFLQDPTEWDSFADRTGIDFGRWNWDALLRAFENDTPGKYRPPYDSIDVISQVFRVPDLRTLMDLPIAFLSSSQPDEDTERLKRCFHEEQTTFTITIGGRHVEFSYNFHEAVEHQLQLADRVVRYSWHQMYAPQEGNERQFEPAIERYRKFMTLAQYTTNIHGMEPFVNQQSLDFVPGLDIDLVWRTHMLSPREYRWFCIATRGGFMEHIPSRLDPEESLDELTRRLYQHVFSEDYGLCFCWPCVDGRRSPTSGNSHLRWPLRKASKTRLQEEMNRRQAVGMNIPLEYGGKQCRKCGSHARRSCREKDILDGNDRQLRTSPRAVSDRVPTPGIPLVPARLLPEGMRAEPSRAPEPQPMVSHPGVFAPVPQRLPHHIVALGTPESAPSGNEPSVHSSNNSKATTPTLTNASTHSADSDEERLVGVNYTHNCPGPSNWRQTTPASGSRSPRLRRNGDATEEGSGDRQDARDMVDIEPGRWLAG
ncbi:hypothetical protein FZEAL_4912 [Fusarium zealandicum]|uniref:Uncharacterized protein n=1 Tax=Fusarium zealandicum TaxID=1053134 RepID=A0A8H4UKT0_9HYPO|nr:hypothetical protein FZEAL_4912 [Fusarium zealandicum]